jgi:hypothetical protein
MMEVELPIGRGELSGPGVDFGRKVRFLPGSAGVERGHALGGGLLPNDEGFPKRRDLRDDVADSQVSSVDSGQHSRRIWQRELRRIRPISTSSPRFAERAGDPSHACFQGGVTGHPRDDRRFAPVRCRRKDAPVLDPLYPKQGPVKPARPALRLPIPGERSELLPVSTDVPLQVLAHGVFYAFAGDEEYGAASDVDAVVGDAFEVVDYEGGPHPPLR